MKIIVNGRFLLHRITGVERYAREILSELDKICLPGEFILAIPPGVENVPNFNNIKVEKVGKMHNRLWEHFSFSHYVHKMGGLSLNLCNVSPLFCPGVTVICDMKIKAYPQFFSKKFLLWYNILFSNTMRYAKKIITISEFSKNEILKYYHIQEDKIIVIPCGWQHINRIKYDESALLKYGLETKKYYFSLSSMDPNKNFKWVAEVARKNPAYVFAIGGSINHEVFKSGLGFEMPYNMKLLGYVTDEEAKTLMRDCKSFIYPSFYEGFGMPPLEAAASGCCSVVISDIPVMHEIFGNDSGVEFVSCNESDSFKVDIMQMGRFPMKNVLNKYAWSKSASILYETLKELN